MLARGAGRYRVGLRRRGPGPGRGRGASERRPRRLHRRDGPRRLRTAASDRRPARGAGRGVHPTITGFEPESTGVMEQCSVGGCANPFPVAFLLNGRGESSTPCATTSRKSASTLSRAARTAGVRRVHPQFRRTVSRSFRRSLAIRHRRRHRNGRTQPRRARRRHPRLGFGYRIHSGRSRAGDVLRGARHLRVGALRYTGPGVNVHDRCRRRRPYDAGRTRGTRFGSGGAPCGGASQCGIVVIHPKSAVPEAFVAVSFAEGPAAQYDLTRSSPD